MNKIVMAHKLFNKHVWKLIPSYLSSIITYKCYCGFYYLIGSEEYDTRDTLINNAKAVKAIPKSVKKNKIQTSFVPDISTLTHILNR